MHSGPPQEPLGTRPRFKIAFCEHDMGAVIEEDEPLASAEVEVAGVIQADDARPQPEVVVFT